VVVWNRVRVFCFFRLLCVRGLTCCSLFRFPFRVRFGLSPLQKGTNACFFVSDEFFLFYFPFSGCSRFRSKTEFSCSFRVYISCCSFSAGNACCCCCCCCTLPSCVGGVGTFFNGFVGSPPPSAVAFISPPFSSLSAAAAAALFGETRPVSDFLCSAPDDDEAEQSEGHSDAKLKPYFFAAIVRAKTRRIKSGPMRR